nr:cen12_2 [Solanum lycopersicum]
MAMKLKLPKFYGHPLNFLKLMEISDQIRWL